MSDDVQALTELMTVHNRALARRDTANEILQQTEALVASKAQTAREQVEECVYCCVCLSVQVSQSDGIILCSSVCDCTRGVHEKCRRRLQHEGPKVKGKRPKYLCSECTTLNRGRES